MGTNFAKTFAIYAIGIDQSVVENMRKEEWLLCNALLSMIAVVFK